MRRLNCCSVQKRIIIRIVTLINRSIRLWVLIGQVLMEMAGHTSIVYSVDSHVSGLIVNGSKDMERWSLCSEYRACGCVWDVKLLENGAILTAYSDGVVRIWTSHQERITDTADLDFYVSQLSQYNLSSTKKLGCFL